MRGPGSLSLPVGVFVTLVAFAFAFAGHGGACRAADAAAAWPLRSASGVLLGFGASYSQGGASRTHSGADLAADAGAAVVAPAAGTVAFVGRVPSEDGGTALAVTMRADTGDKVTLMPLANASVTQGASVSRGEELGSVAEAGDGSVAASHLHVSVRSGSLYEDPLSLFAPPVAEAPDAPAPAPGTAPAPEPASEPAPPAPQSARGPAPDAGQVAGAQSAGGPAGAAAPRATTAHAGRGSVGAARSGALGAPLSRATSAPAARAARVGAGVRAGSTPARPAITWGGLVRAVQARDRALVSVVSYLLASIAASGLIAAAVRKKREPHAQLATSPVRTRT